MREDSNLILLVLTITPVDACCCGKSITCGHGELFVKVAALIQMAVRTYYSTNLGVGCRTHAYFLNINLHSPHRRLIELRIEHADLDAWIDRLAQESPTDQLMLQRLKRLRLAMRDQIARLELKLEPKEPA